MYNASDAPQSLAKGQMQRVADAEARKPTKILPQNLKEIMELSDKPPPKSPGGLRSMEAAEIVAEMTT